MVNFGRGVSGLLAELFVQTERVVLTERLAL